MKDSMTLEQFEQSLQELRAKKGWVVTLEFAGVWVISVHDKETGKLLGETGATSLSAALFYLQTVPLENWK
jgi:hypothetical protein